MIVPITSLRLNLYTKFDEMIMVGIFSRFGSHFLGKRGTGVSKIFSNFFFASCASSSVLKNVVFCVCSLQFIQ